MAQIDGGVPSRGILAFTDRTKLSANSRAAQLLAMATFAFGSHEQRLGIGEDADALGVPMVRPLEDSVLRWRDQDLLDEVTRLAIRDHGASRRNAWTPLSRPGTDQEIAFWEEIERSAEPTALLALLNLSLGSQSEIQRVSAAAALDGASQGQLANARGILFEGLSSVDSHVVSVAQAALGVPLSQPLGSSTSFLQTPHAQPSSITIHGTWARLAKLEDRWYAPGSKLHNHILADASTNLFAKRNYFRWSSGYTERERDQAANELLMWREANHIDELDIVYAHSHGGNVALNALARGEKIRLLVLMHTPAIPREADEWAAIRSNVGRVLVLRTRLDHVVLADGLKTGSTQGFDDAVLPHTRISPHWLGLDGWFSHELFTRLKVWQKYSLANEIVYERSRV